MLYKSKPITIDAFMFGVHEEPYWFKSATTLGLVRIYPNEEIVDNQPCTRYSALLIGSISSHIAYHGYFIFRDKFGELQTLSPEDFYSEYEEVQ